MHQRLRMLNLNFFTPLLLLYIPSSLTPSQFFFKPLLIQQNVFCFMPYISMPLKNPTRFNSFLFFLLFLMIPMVLLSFGSCFPQLFLLLLYFHVFYPVVASQVNTKRNIKHQVRWIPQRYHLLSVNFLIIKFFFSYYQFYLNGSL